MENFLKKFKGKLYPVNPRLTQIFGKRVYSSVKEIPERVYLAVIAVPAKIVPAVMADCVEKKIDAAIILSAGFVKLVWKGKNWKKK